MSRLFLVTGGAGFIGSAIVRALVNRGDRVRVLDDFSTGKRQNLDGLREVEVIEGDIRDEVLLRRACAGVAVVFHEAAVSSVARSLAEPVFTHEVNTTGTLKVLDAARGEGVTRVVYAASASAYGESPALPKVETLPPEPMSPYAVSKLAGEYYCRAFHGAYGLQTVCLRYFNVFGPGQDPASEYAAVIPRFVTAALKGKPTVVFGDGEQSRDFCYIDDVATANLLAADAPLAPGGVFNIARGQSVSLNDLLRELEKLIGADVARRYETARTGDIRHSRADTTLALAHLSFAAQIPFRDGLAKTVEWYRNRS